MKKFILLLIVNATFQNYGMPSNNDTTIGNKRKHDEIVSAINNIATNEETSEFYKKIQHAIKIDTIDEDTQKYMLYLKKRNPKKLRLLLHGYALINKKRSLLNQAIIKKAHNVTEQLVANNANIQSGNLFDMNPFAWAIIMNNTHAKQLLTKNGVSTQLNDKQLSQILGASVSLYSHDEEFNLLGEELTHYPININTQNKSGRSLLYHAIDKNNIPAIRFILNHDADIDKNAYDLASKKSDILDMLNQEHQKRDSMQKYNSKRA